MRKFIYLLKVPSTEDVAKQSVLLLSRSSQCTLFWRKNWQVKENLAKEDTLNGHLKQINRFT